VLAEFDYELMPAPSFPFDTTKERGSMYQLKRYGLPAMYWHGMLRGGLAAALLAPGDDGAPDGTGRSLTSNCAVV
jgi:hypothetical protein